MAGHWRKPAGRVAIDEEQERKDKGISFSAKLRDIVGQHAFGTQWANRIKDLLFEKGLMDRTKHIISANLHSVKNTLFGFEALKDEQTYPSIAALADATSAPENESMRDKITEFAETHGLYEIQDNSGTNLTVQVIELDKIDAQHLPPDLNLKAFRDEEAVLIVMDYAFGEQAYECLDELLKPYERGGLEYPMRVDSVSIMGKAGILEGDKGDIMIPTAHVFEGTADNYPFDNQLSKEDFEGCGLQVFEGTMITVLGTSLQNHDILAHFLETTWNAVGLEMEGAHYQKAIQSASRIRRSVDENVKVFYAYYASDNPLRTGSTLASGSLGAEGILPTYVITKKILEKVLG